MLTRITLVSIFVTLMILNHSFSSNPFKDEKINTVNKGWKQTHPHILELISRNSQSPQVIGTSSPHLEKSKSPIYISSDEESLEEVYLTKLPKKRALKRLKKKRKIKYESSEESESSRSNSDSCSGDEPDTPSIDEDFELPVKHQNSKQKKRKNPSELTIPESEKTVSTRSTTRSSRNTNSNFSPYAVDIESEEDDENELVRQMPSASNIEDFNLVTTIGTRLKLLANVYLANLEGRANIFLPRYTLEVDSAEGPLVLKSFFETPKGEICVFASGGLHHIWEKNIGHIHKIFFGKKVKIIRSHWMQKHLQKERDIKRDLEEEFAGREQELHSEFYYDLFFRHFFIPELAELVQGGDFTLKRLTIHAFSWWDVCNDCETKLSDHQPPAELELELSYKIAARKRYNHAYPETSLVTDYTLPSTIEGKAWEAIWSALASYTNKSFENEEEKEIFWTTTKDGLEVCKWIGQAFRETIKRLDGKAKIPKKGDILAFYTEMQPEKKQALEDLLLYLQDKNWDLSCWYRGPNFPSPTQPKWKRHWKQMIVPNFDWKEVHDFKIKEKERSDHCEMCGYEGLMHVFRVFHPKYHASNKFLNLPKEDQELTERQLGCGAETPFSALPDSCQQKRKQSLAVGSECIKSLCLSRKDIEEWRDLHLDTEDNEQWEVARLSAYDVLEAAEKSINNSKKKKRKK